MNREDVEVRTGQLTDIPIRKKKVKQKTEPEPLPPITKNEVPKEQKSKAKQSHTELFHPQKRFQLAQSLYGSRPNGRPNSPVKCTQSPSFRFLSHTACSQIRCEQLNLTEPKLSHTQVPHPRSSFTPTRPKTSPNLSNSSPERKLSPHRRIVNPNEHTISPPEQEIVDTSLLSQKVGRIEGIQLKAKIPFFVRFGSKTQLKLTETLPPTKIYALFVVKATESSFVFIASVILNKSLQEQLTLINKTEMPRTFVGMVPKSDISPEMLQEDFLRQIASSLVFTPTWDSNSNKVRKTNNDKNHPDLFAHVENYADSSCSTSSSHTKSHLTPHEQIAESPHTESLYLPRKLQLSTRSINNSTGLRDSLAKQLFSPTMSFSSISLQPCFSSTCPGACGRQLFSTCQTAPSYSFGHPRLLDESTLPKSPGGSYYKSYFHIHSVSPGPQVACANLSSFGMQTTSTKQTTPVHKFDCVSKQANHTVYLSKEHEREYLARDTPGPGAYEVHSSLGKQNLSTTHNSPQFHFSRTDRDAQFYGSAFKKQEKTGLSRRNVTHV